MSDLGSLDLLFTVGFSGRGTCSLRVKPFFMSFFSSSWSLLDFVACPWVDPMCHDCRDMYESLILEFLYNLRMKGSGIFFCMSNSVVRWSAELHVLIHGSSSVAKQTICSNDDYDVGFKCQCRVVCVNLLVYPRIVMLCVRASQSATNQRSIKCQ